MSTAVGKKVESKTSEQSVAVETKPKTYRVRNREDHPIVGSITTDRDFIRYTLKPNEWEEVNQIVYDHLKAKFGKPRFRYVVDHKANQERPHEPGEFPRMRKEPKPTYVIEGLD